MIMCCFAVSTKEGRTGLLKLKEFLETLKKEDTKLQQLCNEGIRIVITFLHFYREN